MVRKISMRAPYVNVQLSPYFSCARAQLDREAGEEDENERRNDERTKVEWLGKSDRQRIRKNKKEIEREKESERKRSDQRHREEKFSKNEVI